MTQKPRSRKRKNKKRWKLCMFALGVFLLTACLVLFFKRRASTQQEEQEYAVLETGTEDITARAEEWEKDTTEAESTEEKKVESETEAIEQEDMGQEEKMRKILNQMTLREKAAQLFIITPEQLTGYDIVTQAGSATREALKKYPIGGIIYFSGNLVDKEQLTQMLSNVQEFAFEQNQLPLFLAIDEEGGDIARIGNHIGFEVPDVMKMEEIGKTKDYGQAFAAGSTIGSYLKDFGFNMDFAPDADVITNPDNRVVKTRSFGSDPDLVADMSAAYMDGLMEQGVYGVPKHFPGHGATEGDSHLGFAYANKTWKQLEEAELKPFYAMIEKKAPFIMAGHISLPEITGDDTPGSLSEQVLQGYLRDKMGYEGIIITDALNMGAIQNNYPSGQASVMAFQAGADMLLVPADFPAAYEAVVEAVEDGRISKERLDESVMRILTVKAEIMD